MKRRRILEADYVEYPDILAQREVKEAIISGLLFNFSETAQASGHAIIWSTLVYGESPSGLGRGMIRVSMSVWAELL